MQTVIDIIYGFHMPLFFFVSGIFADRALRYNTGQFLRKRVERYLIPYFLWEFIYVTAKVLTSSLHYRQANFTDFLLSPIRPVGEYWFLYVLFFLSTIYFLLMKITNAQTMKRLFLFLSVAVYLARPFLPDVWILGELTKYALYYALGGWFLYVSPRYEKAAKSLPVSCGILAAFVAVNAVHVNAHIPAPVAGVCSLAIALIGIAAVFALSLQISSAETLVRRFLTFCGINSMQIYCMHLIPMVAFRIILRRVMGANPLWLFILLQTCMTVAVCCAVAFFWPEDPYLHRLLFGEPKRRKT